MKIILFLILFPLAISFLALLPGRRLAVRRAVGVLANATLCTVPIYLLISTNGSGPAYFSVESRFVDAALPTVEFLIAGFIIYLFVQAGSYLPVLLVSLQSITMTLLHGNHPRRDRRDPEMHLLRPLQQALPDLRHHGARQPLQRIGSGKGIGSSS